ncbi:hypothetical protein HAX54_048648 [Datura stramonium]|uniref:Uncharacterized protein n=1 Tax=Datura stramonium TaxID=4076 RepID=A0ABS8WM02_DATST|nr:hypothetical protein [Datura stramonium]
MVLGRSLYFLLNWLSWTGGLFIAVIFSLWDLELGNMMALEGDSGANRGSNSGSWRKYINLYSDNEGMPPPHQPRPQHPQIGHTPSSYVKNSLYPVVLFFRGLSDAAPAPELGEEVQQVIPTHSISQTDLWNSLSSSAPTPCQDNQPPLVIEQTPSVGPSEPRRDLSHVPPRSPPSLSRSDQEFLK